MLLTRSPLIQPNKSQVFSVRLACVKHAASVRPEPGSNSPNKNKNVKAQKNQPNKTAWPAIPTKNTQKQKTGINKTNKHTIEFTNNTHTIKHTRRPACFRKAFCAMFPRSQLFALFAAVRRNKENNTHFQADRQIMTPTRPSPSLSAEFRHFLHVRALQTAQNRPISCCSTQNIKQNVPYAAKILAPISPQPAPIPEPSHFLPKTLPTVDLAAILPLSERPRRIRQC